MCNRKNHNRNGLKAINNVLNVHLDPPFTG